MKILAKLSFLQIDLIIIICVATRGLLLGKPQSKKYNLCFNAACPQFSVFNVTCKHKLSVLCLSLFALLLGKMCTFQFLSPEISVKSYTFVKFICFPFLSFISQGTVHINENDICQWLCSFKTLFNNTIDLFCDLRNKNKSTFFSSIIISMMNWTEQISIGN